MELWVRSQDRLTMMEVNDIRIIDYRGLKEQLQKSILSFMSDMEQMKGYLDKDGWGLSCNETCLGIYETKERALEVLDDIHNALKGNVENHINKFDLYRDDNSIVYQMPKE